MKIFIVSVTTVTLQFQNQALSQPHFFVGLGILGDKNIWWSSFLQGHQHYAYRKMIASKMVFVRFLGQSTKLGDNCPQASPWLLACLKLQRTGCH